MMKKRTVMLATGLLIAVSGVAAASGATGEYNGHPIVNVVVNGKTVQGEAPGINMDGTTLVPLRAIGDAIGAKTGWDPQTSTATITLAAAPSGSSASSPPAQPTVKPEDKLTQGVRELYGRVEDYIAEMSVIREKIRIAKEYYDIKKSDQYFKPMNELYWRAFEDTYLAILTETSSAAMNEARQKDILSVDFMDMLDTAHSAMSYYQLSVEHFSRYVSMGQAQFLEFYINSYAGAFDEELKAKEQFDEAYGQFRL